MLESWQGHCAESTVEAFSTFKHHFPLLCDEQVIERLNFQFGEYVSLLGEGLKMHAQGETE
jgi:hypothetical protein